MSQEIREHTYVLVITTSLPEDTTGDHFKKRTLHYAQF